MTAPPETIVKALRRLQLLPADGAVEGAPLAGGVSSDIWRIETAAGPICAKRALAKLKVAADWRAPVERNIFEARWLARAGLADARLAPRMLGQDAASGVLALEWLDPADHPVWKAELLAGRVDPGFAAGVGDGLGGIHAATAIARDPTVAAEFPTDAIFYAIRLEPYLAATARAWPSLAPQLEALIQRTAATRLTLVHGDVSPKNIQIGPAGPILLDAECAWWGDQAFDVAFCLNHLLLKTLLAPRASADLLAAFDALWSGYRARVDWEPASGLEDRVATMLPGLFLARVDGKSPVEYLTAAADRDKVRRQARAWLARPVQRLADLRGEWAREIGR